MEGTRRFWSLVATSGLVVLLSVLTARPVLLAGGAGVAGLLLAVQWRFLTRLQRLDDSLTVEQSLTRTHVRTGEDVSLTLTVRRAGTLPVTVTAELPPSLPADTEAEVRLDESDASGRTTVTLTTPVVGTVTIDGVTISTTDGYGLFREEFPRGETVTVTVEARQPRNVHVGQGGERTVSTLGAHRSGRLGDGIDPAELREYTPGDTVSDIDWKATARLATPHVREYEVETDRQTVFVFDHRSALDRGPEGETMLAYLREVALALAGTAEDIDDPLGLYTVGDDGITASYSPSTDTRQYRQIRTLLLDIQPTEPARTRRRQTSGPTAARRKAALLGGDTVYDETLRPYFGQGEGYVTRIKEQPLFQTVRTQITRLEGGVLSVVFTDDTDRGQLRETVSLARRGQGHVVMFLTPEVLFEPGALGDLEAAYDRYREFEQFRRDLDRLDGVTVCEVGPGDRIETLLATRREARR